MVIKLLLCLQKGGNQKKFLKVELVGTQMSNYGLENFLKKKKLSFLDQK